MSRSADQIGVGEYYVGTISATDFLTSRFQRRDKFCRRRVVDGSLIHLAVIVVGDGESAGEFMEMFARLPLDHPHQISNSTALWVCGVRDKRSRTVSILDWMRPKKGWQQEA